MPEPNDNPNDQLELEGQVDAELEELLGGEEGEKNKNEKGTENKDKDKNKDGDEPKTFYKKVGNEEFHSEKDYDAYVLKVHGTNSRFAGALKEAGIDPKTLTKKSNDPDNKPNDDTGNKPNDVKPKTAEENYYEIEAIRFKKTFPEAAEYADVMEVLIRTHKADINGEPSFAVALAKSMRADGKQIPERLMNRVKSEMGKDDSSSSRTASKKVMKSGGSGSGQSGSSQETYDEDSFQSLKDFGNKVAVGPKNF